MDQTAAISRRTIRRWAQQAAQAASDFLYPPVCRCCECELPAAAADGPQAIFCGPCASGLTASQEAACRRCGATIGPGLDPALPCMFCRDEKFAFDEAIRLGVYDGTLRTACLGAKRAGGEALAAALAELTWQTNETAFREIACDVIVPVPQHWVQRFLRRHHAAETLAEVWGGRLQVPVSTHILRKVRWTRPQARLKPSERRTNLRRAFATAGRDEFAGATVVLADDVMTTGATAHEAARQLRLAGARVIVAVVARGLGRRS